jgi:DNA-binding beta-propeller fold protein YncE
VRIASTILLVSCALLLSGCSGAPGTASIPAASGSIPGTALQGRVHGGQNPIVGARVYLYAANTNGYGSASSSLLGAHAGTAYDGTNYYVTTQSGGTFTITGDYSCPTATSQVYLYSIGGNPGVGGGANSGAGLMASLGTCNSLSSSTFAVINEVSTVAAAYAFAGFATDATHVSSPSNLGSDTTNQQAGQGIQNAFSTAASLESLRYGWALATTPAGDGTAPLQEINTLANILAACVNSTGPTSGPCSTLFSNAKNGTTTPTETTTAAINIAHNPGANLNNLYGLQVPSAPFQPALTAEPSDFTVSITYTGGGLDGTGFAPNGVAVDGAGNVWVTNYTNSTITEFSSVGAILSGANGYTEAGLSEPTSLAIDIYGNAWAANYDPNSDSVSGFKPNGGSFILPGLTGSGLNQPYGVAFDNLGHIWVANLGGNELSEFNTTSIAGNPLSPTGGYPVGSLVGPAGIASDTSGNIWAANFLASTSSITETDPSGGQSADPSGFTGGGLNSPYGIAIDAVGNVWITNQGGNGSLSEFDSSGNAISGIDGYTAGGLSDPKGLAIDGLGHIWVANFTGNSISEFDSGGNAITGSNGYFGGGLNEPYGVAIDLSGNVWVATDNGTSSLTEFIGAAAPVVTPLSAGVEYKKLGTMP